MKKIIKELMREFENVFSNLSKKDVALIAASMKENLCKKDADTAFYSISTAKKRLKKNDRKYISE